MLRILVLLTFGRDYLNIVPGIYVYLLDILSGEKRRQERIFRHFNVKTVCCFGEIHVRDVVIVILHVLLDELAHCVFQVGIKQLVAAGFGHIGLRFTEKRFKSYHYLCDFLDVSGIRNDYLIVTYHSALRR